MRTHIGIKLTIGLGVLLTAAACGTYASSSTPAAGGANQPLSTSAGGGSTTVSVSTVNGQPVLIDQAGAALYTNNKDNGSTVVCASSDCHAIWTPLTVPGGSKPTAASGVTGTVATVRLSDGSNQVTLNGKPLYTFSFDHGAGHVTGNGTMDSFGGTDFTWHSALASGQQAPAPTTTGNGGGGYGNGYGGGY